MGQRSPTDTLFALVHAFIEQPTWTQAKLAQKLELRTDAVRKRLEEMQAAGFPLDRELDHPHVYWSVPKGWLPGAVVIKTDELPELLRVLLRAPKSAARERVLRALAERLPKAAAIDTAAVHVPEVGADDEETLSVLEDGATRKVAVRMRYFTAGRGEEATRYVSIHRVELGPRARFIATCHRDGALKTFRASSVSKAQLDANEPYRPRKDAEVAAYIRESVDGFHAGGPPVACSFVVTRPESSWAANNLPAGSWSTEPTVGGTRFSITTPSLIVVARFVVGLGDAATIETEALRAIVLELAKGAQKTAKTAPKAARVERPFSTA